MYINFLSIRIFYIVYALVFVFSASTYSQGIYFQIYTNSIYSPEEEVNLNLYAYYIRNNEEFSFSIYRINDIEGFFSRQVLNYNIDVLGKDSMNLLSFCSEVSSFKKSLKIHSDMYYSYANEIFKYKPDSKGAYLVKVSCRNKVAYTGFFVTELGVITNISSDAILIYTVNRNSGQAVNDAELSFFLSTKKIGIGKTQNGFFLKSLDEIDRSYIIENNISYPLIIVQKGKDIAVSNPELYFGFSSERYNAYIYTAQPVYRPDMKVEFRGTVRKVINQEYENFPYKEITIKITDPRGSEVYKEILKTNFNGTFFGEYELPSEALPGQYYITAQIDERNKYSGYFYVEEYKKPEFKIDIILDRNQYGNGDIIKGTVQAEYFFGSPVQDANVEYYIFKKEYYRPWWYFSDYRLWYEQYYSGLDDNYKYSRADLVYNAQGKLNSEGRFDFEYIINEDFKTKPKYWWFAGENEVDYLYIIQARVTDKSRREISSSKTVFVTRADFILNSKTDKYLYSPGEIVGIEINSFDFTDKPEIAEFEAEVYRITWSNYPDYKQNKEFIVRLGGRTDSKGRGFVKLKAELEGYYSVEVNSRDKRGRKVSDKTYFYVSSGDMSWWYNQSGTVQIITDKDSYKPGEICKATVLANKPGVNVLVTAQNNNLISYNIERFDQVSKVIEIPIEDRCSPNFHITVSYVSEGKFYTSSKSVLVIPERKFLTVNVGSDKTVYKPGESASVLIRVTDNEGNPVKNAELSLGIVDESIYSIKSDPAKEPSMFFYSPKWYSTLNFYNDNRSYYGYSRLITIFERFNVRTLSETELGTVRGRVLDKDGKGIASVEIIIDDDYLGAVSSEDGGFEFKLPAGLYKITVASGRKDKNISKKITVWRGIATEVNFNILAYEKDIRDRGITDNSFYQSEPYLMSATYEDSEKKISPDMNNFKEAFSRSDFRDVAYWTPSVVTDENGYASVYLKLPDNLTEWRITSRVITEDTKVGQGIKSVITRKNLLVRLETPRFLQQGDEVTFSTIVHNYLSTEKLTRLSLDAENIEIYKDYKKYRDIMIPSNGEVRIDWKAKVTEPVGFAKLNVDALTDEESDAVEIKIPLQARGLQLTTYNTADISEIEKTEIKTLFIPEFTDLRSASLVLSASPSLASAILGSLDALVGYPYGCVEQTMSRFLPTVVVATAFKELGAPISDATKKNLPKMVEAGYNRLYSMQHIEGGWGWWQNDKSNPFMTAYVVYGLTLADKAGYSVKKDVYQKGINALRNYLKDKDIDVETRTYMLYSLSHIEGIDKKLFEEQFQLINNPYMNDYILALLSVTFSNIGDKEKAGIFSERLLKNVKYQGESGAYWGEDNDYYSWQNDKVQVTAMAVKALMNQPISLKDNPDLLNKAVRWLLMQRTGNMWTNTKTTAFAIYTLVDYLKNSRELDPDFGVKIFLNDEIVAEKIFTKKDVFEKDLKILINGIKLKNGNNILKIEKKGYGKLYFSSDLKYYTAETKIQPRENGFRVEKEYYLLEQYKKYEKNEIIYRKRYFNGEVKSGDEILVKIRVSAKNKNNQYFMLEDPIPAGCEVINNDWAYKIEDEKDYQAWDYYWWRWWYADKDIRDNRVTFFATYLYGDTYEFSYIIRAQIPGSYNVMPATGCLMYYPDVMGSSEDISIKITD